jgi:O-methyltransferase involved in polyketide biosynthesis
MSSDAAEAEAFFKECEEEALAEDQVKRLRDFIARHHSEGSRVVVLTSGGTVRRNQQQTKRGRVRDGEKE